MLAIFLLLTAGMAVGGAVPPPASAAGLPVASGSSAFPDLPTLLTANSNGLVWETLNAADQPTLWAQKLNNGALAGEPVQLTGGNFTRLTADGFVPARNLSIAGTMVAAAGDPFSSFGTEQQRVSLHDLATDTSANFIITGFGDGGDINNQVFFASAAPDGMLFLVLISGDAETPSVVHVVDENMARDSKVDLGALPNASTDGTLLAEVRGAPSADGAVIAYPTTLTDGGGNPEDNLAFVPFNGDDFSLLATGARGSFNSSLITGGGRVAWADYERGADGGCSYYALPLDGSGNGIPAHYNPASFCGRLDGITATAMVLSADPVPAGHRGDGTTCPVTVPTCPGGKLATLDLSSGSVTQSPSVAALSAATDGSSLYVTRGTALGAAAGSAGLYSATSATSPESLLRPAPARPLSADEVALSSARVTWSDDSAAGYPVRARTLTPDDGASLDVGPPQSIAATSLARSPFDGYGLSASGARTGYAVPSGTAGEDRLVVREPGGTVRTVTTYADGTPILGSGGDRVPVPGTLQVSGSNVLYLTADPSGGYDGHLYSTFSQATRDFGPAAAFALSGGYLAWVAKDGSVWRRDIVTDGAPVQLRPPTAVAAGQTLAIRAEVAAAGDHVGWLVRECITPPGGATCTGSTEAAYRDAATMAPAQVVVTAPTTPAPGTAPVTPRNIAMSDHYLLVDELNTGGPPGSRMLAAVRLVDDVSTNLTPVNQYVSGPGKFAASGSTVAWIDPSGAPQVQALADGLDRPRVLTLDAPSSIDGGQPKSFEVVASAPLASCTVTIADGAATVRSLDCGAPPDGDGIASWDGTDLAGSPVPPGTYTWTLAAANAAGTLLDYSGADNPMTGTVTVRSATSTQAAWPSEIVDGSPFTVTATVTAEGTTPTGTVTLEADGATLASQGLAGGTATLTVGEANLTPGSHMLTVRYGGSDTLAPSSTSMSIPVSAAPGSAAASTVSAAWPKHVTYGTPFAVDVRVTAGGAAPAGTVTLTSSGRTLAARSLAGGRAALPVGGTALTPGKHTLAVGYSGSATATASSVDKALLVAKARAKVRASLSKRHVKRSQRAKLTVRVSAAGMIPTGKVRVYDGRKRLAAARLTRAKKGKAVIRLPRLGKVGGHEIRTAYRGSKFAKPATGRTLTLTVGP